MQFEILADDDVDGSFEPVWTCQGILRMPKKRPHKNKDGTLDYFVGVWQVPDYVKWSSVPGFPDFLWKPELLQPGLVRPMTAEERRAYYAVGHPKAQAREGQPSLAFIAGSTCIRVGGEVVRLSAREFEFLRATVEQKTLPREAASKRLEAVKTESTQGVPGFVEYDALHSHRKAILRKVEGAAGPAFKALLGSAFRSQRRTFVYDEGILPTSKE